MLALSLLHVFTPWLALYVSHSLSDSSSFISLLLMPVKGNPWRVSEVRSAFFSPARCPNTLAFSLECVHLESREVWRTCSCANTTWTATYPTSFSLFLSLILSRLTITSSFPFTHSLVSDRHADSQEQEPFLLRCRLEFLRFHSKLSSGLTEPSNLFLNCRFLLSLTKQVWTAIKHLRDFEKEFARTDQNKKRRREKVLQLNSLSISSRSIPSLRFFITHSYHFSQRNPSCWRN